MTRWSRRINRQHIEGARSLRFPPLSLRGVTVSFSLSDSSRNGRSTAALLPAVLLLSYLGWFGTLPAVSWVDHALAAGSLVLAGLAVAALASGSVLDPFRLDRFGLVLPVLLVTTVTVSWWTSDVSRAGASAVILLPFFMLLPSAIERAWCEPGPRHLGLLITALLPGLFGAWALVSMVVFGEARASMPLGHHNLLALVLVALLPLPLLAWQAGGSWRLLGIVSAISGLVALVLTGSLSGALGLLCAAAFLARSGRQERRSGASRSPLAAVAVVGLLVAALFGARLVQVVSGDDASASARGVYAEAAFDGFVAQPLRGHGPGASMWLLADTWRPVPGVNPPGEVVSDPHSLPLLLLFELGLPGILVSFGLVALWIRTRYRELAAMDSQEHWQTRVLDAGLVGWAVVALAGAPLAVPAVPVTLCFLLGARQSIHARGRRSASLRSRVGSVLALALIVGAVVVLPPFLLATRHWDLARSAQSPEEALAALAKASTHDPNHPLYRFHYARLLHEANHGADRATALEEAFLAAERGVGLAPLWLQAGAIAADSRDARATQALERACALDPLGALAPFLAARQPANDDGDQKAHTRRIGLLARALAAEPRLLASPAAHEALAGESERREVRALLEQVDGLPTGWVLELLRTIDAAASLGVAPGPELDSGLAQTLDAADSTAFSLHAFRRSRWRAEIAVVAIDRRLLVLVDELPSAARLPDVAAGTFPVACPGSPWTGG